MVVLGIDVGGNSVKAGVVAKNGSILDNEVILTESQRGREHIIDIIVKISKRLMKKHEIKKIGIGIPGVVDRKGYITSCPNIPFAKFDLGKVLETKLKKKCFFGNDADNFVLANYNFGSGRGKNTIIALTLGTGIGSGIIINGKLFSNKGAPELGHTTIKFDGKKSTCCGNNGCIESYIGRKSFDESPLDVYKKALDGQKSALIKFEEYGKYLGIAISNYVNIFNPDIIILGGEISNAYNFFKRSMDEEIQNRVLFKTKVVKNKLREAGILGAAILAME